MSEVPISRGDLAVLESVARSLCLGTTQQEAMDFLTEIFRMGYLARKLETQRSALIVEQIKRATLNG